MEKKWVASLSLDKNLRFVIVILCLNLILLNVNLIFGEELKVTGEHPFYSYTDNGWVKVKDLNVGDKLLTSDGEVAVIKSIERVVPLERVKVYNLQVGKFSDYYAGDVLVHNKPVSVNNEFKFEDKITVTQRGEWDMEYMQKSGEKFHELLDKLNLEFEKYTELNGRASNLDYEIEEINFYNSGSEVIGNAIDSINIKNHNCGNFIGQIDVKVAVIEGKLRVTVEDNGGGIEPQIEPYLFTWLQKAPIHECLLKNKMNKQITLCGKIGDSLRQLRCEVQSLGGDVFYMNKGKNKGAIFGFEVPIDSITKKSP